MGQAEHPLTDDEKQSRLKAGASLRFSTATQADAESVNMAASRTIQASWLEALALAPARTVAVPLNIDGATIDGPLSLPYATFKYEVSITNSTFTGPVDLSFA